MRTFTALLICCFAVFLTGVWLLSPPSQLPSVFQASDCRRIPLTTADGRELVGVEDLAVQPGTGRIILSAYNRSQPDAPEGGLYAASAFGLSAGQPLRVLTLYSGEGEAPRFRPHGISISPDGERMAVIVRGDEQDAWIELGQLGTQDWLPDRRVRGNSLCRANDLELVRAGADEMLITLDREDCGTSMDDILPGAETGRLARFDGRNFEILERQLAFPNGISGRYVAETRADRLRARGRPQIRLPGGPDNLTRLEDGTLLTALHPSLFQLWIYKNDWRQRAPTRIVRAFPRTGQLDVLFDDPEGLIFSAASSAVLVGDLLVAGSVKDRGVLVCRKRT